MKTLKLVFQRLPLIVGLIACLVWTVGRQFGYFSGLNATPEGFSALERTLAIILVLLSALAIYETTRTFDKPEEQEQMRDAVATLKRIEGTLTPKTIELVPFPKQDEEYTTLFSGFTGVYRAYNPSYQLERRPGLDRDSLVKNVHARRYKDPDFQRAYYLFFTGDESGKNDLKEFSILMRATLKYTAEVKKKIEVRQQAAKAADSEAEIYLGTKGGIFTAIFEPTEAVLTGGRGKPHYYFIITNKDVNNRLLEQFHKDWDAAVAVDVFSAAPAVRDAGEKTNPAPS